MGKKGKGKGKKKKGGGGGGGKKATPVEDDDWGAALDEFAPPAPETKSAKPSEPEKPAAAAVDTSAADALAFLNGGVAPKATPAAAPVAASEPAASDTADNADDAALAFLGLGGSGGAAPAKEGGTKKKRKKKAKKTEAKKPAPKNNAMAARIKAQQEQRRQEEEEQRLLDEEEKQKEEEEAAVIAAIAKTKQDKKDAKKARQAQRKADGLVKTKAERQREEKAARARQQMIDSGMITNLPTGEQKNQKRSMATKKKSGLNKMERKEQARLKEIAAAEARAEEVAKAKAAEAAKKNEEDAESSGGDWEDEDDDDVTPAVVMDDLKEFSDDDSDEELAEARHAKRIQEKLKQMDEEKRLKREAGGDDDSGSEDWEDEEDEEDEKEVKLEEARIARESRHKELLEERSADDLRSPILCVLGHVDTGKTKLLDKIRRTNVQDGEAGGITQQIGATYFPMENIRQKTQELNKDFNLDYRVPGLLVIDTPGHESFTNLRSRGSNLCDIAILVIDIMHGLEPQTIESIQLLRKRKTPFIVALNKIDRLYGWKICKDQPIRKSLSQQSPDVVQEFESRTKEVLGQLMEHSLNAKLYYENDDFRRNVSVVPTSAITGEGVPDILLLTVQITQDLMTQRLMYSAAFECTLLEVKVIPGLGTTIDVVLINGVLHDSDTIVVCGINGPIITPIRALLTPQLMKELRLKSEYVHNKTIKAAMGIKISAQNLDGAIAGTNVMVYRKKDGDNLDEIKQAVMEDFESVMGNIKTVDRGVYVQASTLGALEALLEFLRSENVNIPVCGVSIGPVHKKDVMKASVMLEHKPEWAVILAFDVKVTKDAKEHSENLGVRIFTADIIYHLQDSFMRYTEEQAEIRKEEADQIAVFPCCLKILKSFREKNPIILGVEVLEGILRVGTPICVPDVKDEEGDPLVIGTVSSIEENHKEKNQVGKGSQVAVKLEGGTATFNRQFNKKSTLYSRLTRPSIDALKENFKNDIDRAGWTLVIQIKKMLDIGK